MRKWYTLKIQLDFDIPTHYPFQFIFFSPNIFIWGGGGVWVILLGRYGTCRSVCSCLLLCMMGWYWYCVVIIDLFQGRGPACGNRCSVMLIWWLLFNQEEYGSHSTAVPEGQFWIWGSWRWIFLTWKYEVWWMYSTPRLNVCRGLS